MIWEMKTHYNLKMKSGNDGFIRIPTFIYEYKNFLQEGDFKMFLFAIGLGFKSFFKSKDNKYWEFL